MLKKTGKVSKNYTFVWAGKDKRGQKLKGEMRAPSANVVKVELRRQHITATKIRKKSTFFQLSNKNNRKITSADISVFSRQMATMISSGIPLVQSFEIVAGGNENKRMQDLVISLKSDVESGSNFAEALCKYPNYFNELFCNLIHAGEQSGSLETMLNRIASYNERMESLKKKIKKALFYPASIIVVAAVVTCVLLIFVVPQFESLFRGFGADLPSFTKIILKLSAFLQNAWWVLFALALGLMVLFSQMMKKSVKFVYIIDHLVLSLPVVGGLLRKAIIARFARTVAITFAAGLPLVEALQSVANSVGNNIYRDAILKIKDEVETGQQLQVSMRNSKLFPSMVLQMIGVGEEAGSLDSMLSKVADFYEEEVDTTVDNLSSMIEPMIMIVLGVLIGGLIIAMYLPIFKLGSVV